MSDLLSTLVRLTRRARRFFGASLAAMLTLVLLPLGQPGHHRSQRLVVIHPRQLLVRPAHQVTQLDRGAVPDDL